MQTKRQKQVSELIRRNFGNVLFQEGNLIYQDALVTVTHVELSPDFSSAKIYLSIYNTENKQAVYMLLQDSKHRLKQSLVHRIRKHVRRIPSISLFMDDTLDEMYRLDALFDKLHKDNQMGEEE